MTPSSLIALSMIALHRPALMSELYWLKGRISELCAGTPWGDRIKYSLCIGAGSARSILKALSDLLLYSKISRVITANQTLLAILVLGIYITKVPESLMSDSDLAVRPSQVFQYGRSLTIDAQNFCWKNGKRFLRDGPRYGICQR
jgi:hypothetical protein